MDAISRCVHHKHDAIVVVRMRLRECERSLNVGGFMTRMGETIFVWDYHEC